MCVWSMVESGLATGNTPPWLTSVVGVILSLLSSRLKSRCVNEHGVSRPLCLQLAYHLLSNQHRLLLTFQFLLMKHSSLKLKTSIPASSLSPLFPQPTSHQVGRTLLFLHTLTIQPFIRPWFSLCFSSFCSPLLNCILLKYHWGRQSSGIGISSTFLQKYQYELLAAHEITFMKAKDSR